MPGRAIKNKFLEKVEEGTFRPKKCLGCISTCDFKTTKYCITKALINAVQGNLDEALLFCGSNVSRINKIVPVQELMDELVQETEVAYAN